MKSHFCIFFLILIYACTNSVQRRDKFNRSDADGRKNGEYTRYENGKVIQRDYYLDDTICLSIYYSKDNESAIYAQVFEHNDIERQIVFNSREFNNYFFSLQEKEVSDQEKGKKMFRYYCISCHSGGSRDVSLKKVKDDTTQLYALINSASHPISFKKMDSIELHYLRSYILSF
ncbi:MAG TPA: hypothetical protein VGD35_05240 [Chitinophaga sp.]